MNPKLTLKSIPWIILFIVSLAIPTHMLALDSWNDVDLVKIKMPEIYPVVVVKPGESKGHYDATIVNYADLKAYTSRMKRWSYRIPAGKIHVTNARLKPHWSNFGPYRMKSIEVIWAIREEQYIKVTQCYGEEDVRIAWYIARSMEIKPRYYKYSFTPSLIICTHVPIAFMLNLPIWLFVRYVYMKAKRRSMCS